MAVFFFDLSAIIHSMAQRYKCKIAYDGTAYGGWQVQPTSITIQSLIQEALARLHKTKIHVTASGRTDSGVHALAQVAHFDAETPVNIRALNGILPRDIRILSITPIEKDFHARYSATGKTYRYHLSLGEAHDPFTRQYSHHMFYTLDPELLTAAAAQFIGTHDFTSFANSASEGAASKNAVRTITKCAVIPTDFGYTIEVSGNGFLYKMVRNIVGCLIQIATGKLPLETITHLLKAKDRTLAPPAAPAKGLFLCQVHYPERFSCE